jgi:hypothetical protein
MGVILGCMHVVLAGYAVDCGLLLHGLVFVAVNTIMSANVIRIANFRHDGLMSGWRGKPLRTGVSGCPLSLPVQ